MRDIGNAGEAKVIEWCSLAGIVTNKANIDRYGWDFLFEMSSHFDLASSSGLHESNYECKVQIKTTDGGVKSLPIELSNLRSMATTLLPSFYLMIDYDKGPTPKSARLLHIDNNHCEKILAKVRAETSKNKNVRLNKKTMSLSFKEAIEVSPLSGEGLKTAIATCIGRSQGEYVSKKHEFLRKAGYGVDALRMSFSANQQDMKRFVEMALGGKDKIQINDVRAFSTRFGIPEEIPGLKSDSALMSISVITPNEQGKVAFRNRKTGARSEWEVEVLRAALGNWLPDELKVLRLRADRFHLDIGYNLNKFRFDFHKSDEDASETRELIKFYKLLIMLQNPSEIDMTVTIESKDLRAALSGDGFQGEFEKGVRLVNSIQRIQQHFDNYDELKLSPLELISNQAKIFNYLNFIEASNDKMDATAKFTAKGLQLDSVDCIVPFILVLGDMCFISLCAVGGDLTNTGIDEYEIKITWRKPIYRTCCNVSSLEGSGILVDLERAAQSYETTSAILDYSDKFLRPLIEQGEDPSLF